MEIRFSEKNKKQLRSLGVIAVYLFGSRAVGAEGPLSDYDLGFLMEKTGYRRGDKTYNKIYDLLSPLCPRTMDNDVIDIIFLNDAPLELRSHVIRYGKVLFDEQPLQRGRFEEKTIKEYCDFRPLLNQIDQAILAAL